MLIRIFAAVRGLLYAAVFFFLWWWVALLVQPLDARIAFPIPAWVSNLGLVIAALGGLICLACVVAFALVGKGTPAPFDAPRDFVATGPYRYVRNPMYLGAIAVIIGAGLAFQSPSALVVVFLFIAFAHGFLLLYEEPALERRFGESYRKYKKSVNRWLPRIPRSNSST